MSTRLLRGFVLSLALLLLLGGTTTAQPKKLAAAATDAAVALNWNAGSTNQAPVFVDPVGQRVCSVTNSTTSTDVVVQCFAITVPAGAPVVALNPLDSAGTNRFFVVGGGVGTTQACRVDGAVAPDLNPAHTTCTTVN